MRKREEKKVYTHNIQSERGVRTTLWHTSLDVVPRWKMLPSHAFKNLWLFFSLPLDIVSLPRRLFNTQNSFSLLLLLLLLRS